MGNWRWLLDSNVYGTKNWICFLTVFNLLKCKTLWPLKFNKTPNCRTTPTSKTSPLTPRNKSEIQLEFIRKREKREKVSCQGDGMKIIINWSVVIYGNLIKYNNNSRRALSCVFRCLRHEGCRLIALMTADGSVEKSNCSDSIASVKKQRAMFLLMAPERGENCFANWFS